MNGEVRDREKVMRGLKYMDTPILKGVLIYHNFVRPHEGLKGKTPAEAAGIRVEGVQESTDVHVQPNALFYGDNLQILQKYFDDESVDLIYLDPPFNSKADYNVLFKEVTGLQSEAQLQAFTDSWRWDEGAENAYLKLQERGDDIATATVSLVKLLKRSNLSAYLVMMAIRLVELHRVLKRTGSLYLHCDPTASHYLKVILDVIFDPRNFKNEIIWKRTSAHNALKFAAPYAGRSAGRDLMERG